MWHHHHHLHHCCPDELSGLGWGWGGGQTGAVISLEARFYCPLNDREDQQGHSHPSPPPVSLFFSSLLSTRPHLLSSFSRLSSLFCCFVTCFNPPTPPPQPPLQLALTESPCDGADFPQTTTVATFLRAIGLLSAFNAQRAGGKEISRICAAAVTLTSATSCDRKVTLAAETHPGRVSAFSVVSLVEPSARSIKRKTACQEVCGKNQKTRKKS